MPLISLGAQKRPAEAPAEDPRLEDTGARGSDDTAPVSIEQVCDTPAGPPPSGTGSAGSFVDASSLEAVESGALTAWKAELLGIVKQQVRGAFRTSGVDVSEGEVNKIALMSVEVGAVDIAEIYSPHRVTARAAEFGLRPGFAVDLQEQKPSGGP